MRLRGSQEGFEAWCDIRDLMADLIQIHPDSLGSRRDLHFWVPFLDHDQVLKVVTAGGWEALLPGSDPIDVLTDMLDTMRYEAGLSGYYSS